MSPEVAVAGWTVQSVVGTLGLLILRIAPVVLLMPLFGSSKGSTTVRASVIAMLAFVTWPSVPPAPPVSPGLALLGELVLGLAFGAALLAIAEGARMVGALSDTALGRGSMGAGDPLAGGPAGPLSTLYALFWCALFVVAGGHLVLVEGLDASLRAVPLGQAFDVARLESASALLVDALTASFTMAVAFALPAMVVSWIVDLTLGWLTRALPQLPAMFLAMPVRAVLGVILVAAALAVGVEAFVARSLVVPSLWSGV